MKLLLDINFSLSGILALYLPVAAAGYGVLGNTVSSNILLSLEFNAVVKTAIVLEIVNLLGTYLISFNPIGQGFEEVFNVPKRKLIPKWNQIFF